MSNKGFIEKYEELLNKGYCECNELNCLDNNSPRKILCIMKEQEQEIERLEEENERYRIAINEMAMIICKAIEYIEENAITEITWWVGKKPTRKELFKDGASLYELLEILRGDKE